MLSLAGALSQVAPTQIPNLKYMAEPPPDPHLPTMTLTLTASLPLALLLSQ